MNVLKGAARRLWQQSQSVLRPHMRSDYVVVISGEPLVEKERAEILTRLRFFVPAIADRAIFRTTPLPTDLMSRAPILTFAIPPSARANIRKFRRDGVFDVDHRRNHAEGGEWLRLSHYVAPAKPDLSRARAAFRAQIQRLKALNLGKAYVFGTGRSLADAISKDWSDGYRVVCNTIVRDPELWNHIEPHFIVAADTIYHFGFTDFAKAFRADLRRRLSETETYFVYPERFHAIVEREFGSVAERLIPVPQGHHDRLVLDLEQDFELSGLGNILNILLLPIACTLQRNVFLWGLDGRAPNDRLFWANSEKHSYPELMDSLLNAHPAFFATHVPATNPAAYVNEVHGDAFDARLADAEARGWSFTMMHPSWTPALQKRFRG